jgi:hypothetical protein
MIRRGRAALCEHIAVEQPAALVRDEAPQRRIHRFALAAKRREVILHHRVRHPAM